MDIYGLVNHNPQDNKRFGSLSPPENSGSDSARSQYPVDSALPQHSPSPIPRRDRDEMYPSLYSIHSSTEQTASPIKRPLDFSSLPPIGVPPAKRRLGELNGENGKKFPTRRRAHQACEACRAKKSKCDNVRPSCGSCTQHDVECIYKGASFVPMYRPGKADI
jgi:hypothetical protein